MVAKPAASNGSVNSMHDSYRPLGALAPMFNMAVGEVIWGGVGSGLYGMIFYAVIAVFMGGLMVATLLTLILLPVLYVAVLGNEKAPPVAVASEPG